MPRDIFQLAYSVQMNAESSDTAEIMLYGQIIQDTPEAWKWSKEDKSAVDFDKAVKEVRAKGAKKLLLRINSPGGVCTQAVAMRTILGSAGFDEVNIRIEGMCASAATDIATLPGAHVAIAEGAEYMIHNPWCITIGNANELMQTIEHLRNIEQMSRGFYAKRTGQTEEQIREWMDAETWFTAEQAVEYGFADELLEMEVTGETPAAACVTSREMAVLHGLYKAVPEQIATREDAPQNNPVSNAAPVAGEASENNNHEEEHDTMEIKDINVDQLRADNPALLEQIRQDAVDAERQRIEDIDALTLDGFEQMAEDAKRSGMSATDFQKQVVKAQQEAIKAQKQKGKDYMEARKKDTEDAKDVAGGASEDNDGKTEEEEIKDLQAEVKNYAAVMRSGNETMY